MSGEGEIIGDIAQGALVARAAEPEHGEAGDGHAEANACLNCGTRLAGRHCHGCGQAAVVHRSLGAFFHDLLHGVFHFEGKIWRTLPVLAWHPGRLTREYVDGRRASYVSPIALFLFVVFLTFAVVNQLGSNPDLSAMNSPDAKSGLEEARADIAREIASLEGQLAAARSEGLPARELEALLRDKRGRLASIKQVQSGMVPDPVITAETAEEADLVARINAVLTKVQRNPELAFYKLQSNAYKFSWLLIPISLPFLWLLFPFSRRFGFYDHLIFVTYSLSFMMILLIVGTLADLWPWTRWLGTLTVVYAPLHLYRQLRGAYGLSHRSALLRLPLLLAFAVLALVAWGVALLALVITG